MSTMRWAAFVQIRQIGFVHCQNQIKKLIIDDFIWRARCWLRSYPLAELPRLLCGLALLKMKITCAGRIYLEPVIEPFVFNQLVSTREQSEIDKYYQDRPSELGFCRIR